MFKDRDLFVIGAGALLAIFCLLLPFSFALKVFLGLTTLILFMVLGLARFGGDRIPLEEWLKRRLFFKLRPRKHVYQQPGHELRATPPAREPAPEPEKQPSVASPAAAPVTFAFEGNRIYHLAGVFLAVVGVYFVTWLAQGGAAAIARDIDIILRGVFP